MISCKNLKITDENIEKLELARFDAYGMKTDDFDLKNTFSANQLRNKKYLAFGAYLEDKLVGGCYVSNSRNSLYIEELFVRKDASQIEVGTNLLKYVLKRKSFIEKYYCQEFNTSCLENREELNGIYQSLGYRKISPIVMSKRFK